MNEKQSLLEEITSLFSNRTNGGRVGVQYVNQMKSLLPKLINRHLAIESTRGPSELRLYVLLLKHLSIETPAVFWYDGKSIIGNIYFRLLAFLSNPEFLDIHKSLRETIVCLMNLLLSGNLAAYRSFVRDSLELLQNLGEVLQYFQEHVKGATLETPIVIKCYTLFGKSFLLCNRESLGSSEDLGDPEYEEEVEAECYYLPLTTVHECIISIENLTDLVSTQIERVPQFLEDLCAPLWTILLKQIERGSPQVKQASLNCLQVLLTVSTLPTYFQSSYLITLLTLMHPRYQYLRSTLDAEFALATCLTRIASIAPAETIQLFSVEFFKNLDALLQEQTLSMVFKETIGFLLYVITTTSPINYSRVSVSFGCPIISPYLVASFLKYISNSKEISAIQNRDQNAPPPKRRKLDFGEVSASEQPESHVQTLLDSIPQEILSISLGDSYPDILYTLTTIRTLLFVSHNLDSPLIYRSLVNNFLHFVPELTQQKLKEENENLLQEERDTQHSSPSIFEIYELTLVIICDLLGISSNLLSGPVQSKLFDAGVLLTSIPFTLSWETKSDDDLQPRSETKVSIILRSLETICSFPKSIAEKSATLFLRCLKCEREEIQSCAVELLPAWIHTTQSLSPKMLKELQSMTLSSSLQTKNLLAKTLARTIGSIACLSANPTCPVTRSHNIFADSKEKPYSLPFPPHLDVKPPGTLALGLRRIVSLCECAQPLNRNEREVSKSEEACCSRGTLENFEANWKGFFSLQEATNCNATQVLFLQHSFGRIAWHTSLEDIQATELFWREKVLLLMDHCSDVRRAMVGAIKYYTFPSMSLVYCSEGTQDSWILFKEINKLLRTQAEKNDFELLSSLLAALGEIGSFVDGEFLSVIVLTLVENVVSERRDVRALAYDQLRFIAGQKNVTVKQLAEDFHEHIDPFLVSKLRQPELVDEAASALYDITDFHDWLTSTLPVTLPRLIARRKSSEFCPLEKLAQILETSVASLLDEYMHYVLPYVLILHPSEEMKDILTLIQQLSNHDRFRGLVSVCPIKLVTEIIMMLYHESVDTKNRAHKALEIIHNQVSENESPPTSPTGAKTSKKENESLSDYLSSIFFSLTCNTIHPKMQSKHTKLAERLQILLSFQELMKLLGSNLYSLRPKVMTTLKLFSQQSDLASHACAAWKTFICNIEPAQLGPILSQVIAELLPFFDSAPQEVFSIFEYLKLHRKVLRPYLDSVPYIPDIPLLADVRPYLVPVGKSFDLTVKISQLHCGLKHKSEAVQKQAVEQLCKVLYENREQVHDALSQSIPGTEASSLDTSFFSLMKQLLEGCINARNSEVKILYGKALGELGAMDPTRMDEINLKPAVEEKKNETELAVELVETFLVNHLRAAYDPIVQNKIGFALQELLSLCGCSFYVAQAKSNLRVKKKDKERFSQGKETWERFSSEIQEILRPFLTSQYELQDNPTRQRNEKYRSVCQKMMHTNPKNGYVRWIGEWTVSLISKTKGKYNKIFRACRGAVKHNVDIALYLLPYILLDVLLNGSEIEREAIRQEIMDVLQLGRRVEASPSRMEGESSPLIQMCMQTVFSMIDILTTWVDQQKVFFSRRGRRSKSTQSVTASHVHIEKLLEEVPHKVLATASFQSRAFPRSLFHYELFIRSEMQLISMTEAKKSVFTRSRIEDLEKIYMEIDEPDGLNGIETLRSLVMERDVIREHENLGHWSDAFAGHDHHLQQDASSLPNQLGRLRCLQHLGHLETMLSLVFSPKPSSLLRSSDITKTNGMFASYGIKAAWRLGKWNVLRRFLPYMQVSVPKEFDVSIGKLLLHLANSNQAEFCTELNRTALDVVQSLSAASMESYKRAYPFIVQLHVLREIEDWYTMQQQNQSESQKRLLLQQWKKRVEITSPSVRVRDLLLHVHQVISFSEKFYNDSCDCWLQVASLARKEKQYDTCASALTKASNIESQYQLVRRDDIALQSAKLQWSKENHLEALLTLQSIASWKKDSLPDSKKAHVARILLLEGKWLEKTGQKCHNEVIQHYVSVIKLCPSWEKAYLVLGKYYDALLQHVSPESHLSYEGKAASPGVYLSYLSSAIDNYGKALQYGHKYIYQSLPRLLTLWLDNGSMLSQYATLYQSLIDKELLAVSTAMCKFQKVLPNYLWLTCFPQLVSAICYEQRIFMILERIIYSVLVEYPQQSFWALVAVSKSTHRMRNTRASDILAKAKKTSEKMKEFLGSASSLCQHLLSICNYRISNQTSLSIRANREFRPLLKLAPLDIIVPLQASLTVSLPGDGKHRSTHQPFPEHLVTIANFRDNIDIMSSLIKPRKITIVGSDGEDYMFLCKPRDDLRKDARVMDFNNILNKLLRKNAESRRRQLHIRTYGVIPLNETCGLIEWVENTSGYRHVLSSLMTQHYPKVTGASELKKMYANKSYAKNPRTRFDDICQKFPPIFYRWFIQEFPEPSAWFSARLSFSRTAAVMSMVGTIVGLGDRHGENILLDELTGEVVHIDLNCLFWKGRTFEEPEVVPFRLTPHMVDALGITGYEGVFRRVCEITLGVLRGNRDTLMSVLQPLIDDPLVEATHKNSSRPKSDFIKAINDINKLLKGQYGLLPLSVEGHVHKLLAEATNPDNLCKMYIGWTPWL